MSDVTEILKRVNAATDPNAAQELANVVYRELRIIARARMRDERTGHTLQPTALVHEAWVKLFHGKIPANFRSRRHFFGSAAKAMRRILVDYARKRNAQKRGEKVDMSASELASLAQPVSEEDVPLDFDAALERYGKTYPARVNLIELRYCAQVKVEEAAHVVGMSKSTAERALRHFQAWFKSQYGKISSRASV